MPLPLNHPCVSPYLAPDELRNFYGQAEIDQLADRNNDNVADAAPAFDVVQGAIERAAAVLEQHLGRCYVLPLAANAGAGFAVINPNVATLLAEWTGIIARYLLWDDVRPVVEGDNRVPEPRRRYQDLIKSLKADCNAGADCTCTALAPSVLTLQATGFAANPNMPLVESDGSHFARSTWHTGALSLDDAASYND